MARVMNTDDDRAGSKQDVEGRRCVGSDCGREKERTHHPFFWPIPLGSNAKPEKALFGLLHGDF